MIDREALVQMAANRQVRNGDEVWFQERWQAVSALPELQGRVGADPWEAWEGEDPAETAPPAASEPEEVEAEPIVEVPRRVVIRKPPPPPAEPEPEPGRDGDGADDEEPANPAEPSGMEAVRGQVIAFPSPRPRLTLPDMPARTPRVTPPVVRWSRVGGFLILGGAGLAVAWLWVLMAGSTAGVRHEAVMPAATTSPVPLHPTGSTDPSRELLQGLRGRLPQEVESVHQPADLGDAILIELQNLETSVEGVDAVVTAWTGPKRDQPKEATVVVTFRDTQTLERDLAAFGLVLGRYMRAYAIRVPDARVVFHSETGDMGRSIDAQTAVELYNGRLTLAKFVAQE